MKNFKNLAILLSIATVPMMSTIAAAKHCKCDKCHCTKDKHGKCENCKCKDCKCTNHKKK